MYRIIACSNETGAFVRELPRLRFETIQQAEEYLEASAMMCEGASFEDGIMFPGGGDVHWLWQRVDPFDVMAHHPEERPGLRDGIDSLDEEHRLDMLAVNGPDVADLLSDEERAALGWEDPDDCAACARVLDAVKREEEATATCSCGAQAAPECSFPDAALYFCSDECHNDHLREEEPPPHTDDFGAPYTVSPDYD